ncbi:MAG: ABC transporter ATP-binding protein, partial [Eubacteriales bacterium]|nr:ABC transporter ATP-binding protein [Eubacteriales bacterium]
MDYLRLQGLAVGYNGRALIKNIEIGVQRGEIVTLVGPNGSGKSTILKSITRQLVPVAGKVELEGRALESYAPSELAKKMAVMLTGRMQPELMTCRDVASMGRYPYTGRLGILSDADEAIVEKAIAAVHAQFIADRPFDAVSDGERQRILLARAICQEPEIIILDEPTSYLDIRHKLELLSILRAMAQKQGITVVMSLHEVDLAMKVSDRVICVRGEEIFACGAPEEVLSDDVIRELYGLGNRMTGGPESKISDGRKLRDGTPAQGKQKGRFVEDNNLLKTEVREEPSCAGSFDALTGSVELPPPTGEPDVFVLSSGGSGIPVYRKLQRRGIPFIAGILYRNDIDWRAARLLAAEVIDEAPFEEISDAAFSRALDCVRRCSCVIDAGVTIGTCNRRMADLLAEAEKLGKLK